MSVLLVRKRRRRKGRKRKRRKRKRKRPVKQLEWWSSPSSFQKQIAVYVSTDFVVYLLYTRLILLGEQQANNASVIVFLICKRLLLCHPICTCVKLLSPCMRRNPTTNYTGAMGSNSVIFHIDKLGSSPQLPSLRNQDQAFPYPT